MNAVGRPSGDPAADAPSAAPSVESVSVVVVNWNGGEMLQDCLASLSGDCVGSALSDVEIVLVDNGSTDGSVELAASTFPGIRTLRQGSNGGFAAGANAGIRASTGSFVVLINNDAVVRPGFLRAITAPMTDPGGEDIGAVTGRVVLAGSYAPVSPTTPGDDVLVAGDGRRWARLPETAQGGMRLLNSTGNVVTRSGNGGDRDWLASADTAAADVEVFGFNGGCAALRRRALDEVGLFDARLFMYFEDSEMSWRLRRSGWRIVHAHDAVSEHRHAASSGTHTAFFEVHNARNRLVVALSQAPWPVVLRALGRTLGRLARGPRRGRTARALAGAVRMAPAALVRRRETDRRARVPREEVARLLVDDGRRRVRDIRSPHCEDVS